VSTQETSAVERNLPCESQCLAVGSEALEDCKENAWLKNGRFRVGVCGAMVNIECND
jgi:hypothetical protein